MINPLVVITLTIFNNGIGPVTDGILFKEICTVSLQEPGSKGDALQ
jgi:hypothetical protein